MSHRWDAEWPLHLGGLGEWQCYWARQWREHILWSRPRHVRLQARQRPVECVPREWAMQLERTTGWHACWHICDAAQVTW